MSLFKQAVRAGVSALALSLGIVGFTVPVRADGAAPAAQGTGAPQEVAPTSGVLEEVVVTARRREENLQTVPVSVTAFSASALAERDVEATTDLQKLVPGVVFTGAGSDENTTFNIRGQGKDVVGPGLPSVISYFNEVPLPSWGSVLPAYDVSSIQVLKGPQGTLFGRNTTGGAVLVYSAPATYNFGGYFEATLGDYNWHGLQGAINVPIVDGKVALRVAGEVVQRDGYQKNIGVGGDGADVNSRAVRVTLRFDPTDNIRSVVVYDYYWKHTHGAGEIAIGTTTPNPLYRSIPGFNCGVSASCDVDLALAVQRGLGFHTYDSNVPEHDDSTIWGISNTTTADLDVVSVKNIFGYRDTAVNLVVNDDGLPLSLGDTQQFRYDRQISDELQFSGSLLGDRLKWLAGAFYLDDKPTGPEATAINIFDAPGVAPADNPFGFVSNGLYTDRSKALFANLSYEIIHGLKLNAGYRETWDREGVCGFNGLPVTATPVSSVNQCVDTPGTFSSSVGFKAPTHTFGVDYNVNDNIFAYVTARRGYRAGGINSPMFNPNAPNPLSAFQFYQPQVVNDVEVGTKTEWKIGEAVGRFNAAAFRSKFTDQQRLIQNLPPNLDGDNNPADDPASTSLVINGAESVVQGFEAEGFLAPTSGLSFNVGVSYLDARYTSIETPAIFAGEAGSFPVYENTPKWSYTTSGRYVLPFKLSGANLTLNVDYYHVAKYLVGLVTVPAYGVADANLQLTDIGDTGLTATLFVNNLTDKTYLQNSDLTGAAPGVATFSIGAPRMIGVRLRYEFGGHR